MTSVASLVLVATVYAGGWAIVTVRDLPEYAVAGKPLQLTFMVRGHGVSPLANIEPEVVAKSGKNTVKARAFPTKKTGEYTASLALSRPGNWTIQITGTVDDPILPELTVIAPGSPAPSALSQSALGKRLFVSKGCIGCHVNREVRAENQGGVGPDLTGKRFPETYLKSLLADPKATFGSKPEGQGWEMPNLELTKSEIAALTAFVNRERPR
jgi:mono/diheme cytochrome c family protein